jgi:predicted DsbA family dithiol-disulfide isomerase
VLSLATNILCHQESTVQFLKSNELKSEVVEEVATWQERVSGVPFFVIDDKCVICN